MMFQTQAIHMIKYLDQCHSQLRLTEQARSYNQFIGQTTDLTAAGRQKER